MITNADPRTLLSPQQLACVRLEHRGPSKVIARELGLSPHTIDDHFREAKRRLGVRTRAQAAELVRRWDADGPPQAWGDQAPGVAKPGANDIMGSSVAPAPMPVERFEVREDRAVYGAEEPPAPNLAGLTRMWLGKLGDELTTGNVIRGMLWTALLIILIVTVVLGLGIVVQQVIVNISSGR